MLSERAPTPPRQHRLVDSGNLVGQRFDERSVDRQDRVKQVREPNPLCLGDQPEEGPIAFPDIETGNRRSDGASAIKCCYAVFEC